MASRRGTGRVGLPTAKGRRPGFPQRDLQIADREGPTRHPATSFHRVCQLADEGFDRETRQREDFDLVRADLYEPVKDRKEGGMAM